MYKIGALPAKVSPPHRGHISMILDAGTKCEKLYVVVSHNDRLEKELYKNTGFAPPTLKQKLKWLSIELQDFEHISVIGLEEDENIPVYPYGWKEWSAKLNELVPDMDVIFGSETSYADEGYTKYFPNVKYELYDTERSRYPISATKIRENPYKYWEYILGSAREHFVRRVLITGTESCGKTTLTKALAKEFFTSWAQEEGRYYSQRYFGGNESVFELDDFYNICWEQKKLDQHAIRTANKVAIFDTDAVVTQYYCNLYLNEANPKIETLVDKDAYDVVLFMKPDVRWVDDGQRWNSDQIRREMLHAELKQMYIDRGFGDKIVEIGGNYNDRYSFARTVIDNLLK